MSSAWSKVTLVTSSRLRTSHQVSRLPVPKGSYGNPSCSAHLGSDGKGEEENFSCDNVLCRARLATAHQLAKLLVERAQSLNTQRMTGKRRQVAHADSPNMLWKMPTINFQQYVFLLLQPSEMLLKQQKKMLSNYSNK